MTDDETVVEAEVVPPDGEADHSRSLARTQAKQVRHEVLHPLDVGEQVQAMEEHQRMLRSILDGTDYQDAGGGRRFVKKSGWRKIAAAYSISIELIRDDVIRADDGSVARAQVWARAIAPSGRYADGDGYCDVEESRFSGNRGNRSKLENDLRGTATTRAANRAISNLVGMGDVSAEESEQGPPYGPPHGDMAKVARAVAFLLDVGEGPDTSNAGFVMDRIKVDAGGYLPQIVGRALLRTAATLANKTNEEDTNDEPSTDAGAGDAGDGGDEQRAGTEPAAVGGADAGDAP